MIQVSLVFGKQGELLSCNAQGHAEFAERGSDIVCAAVTILVRTVFKTLSDSSEIKLMSDISSRGKLAFSVEDFPVAKLQQLIYAGAFLQKGLASLVHEYPQCVALREQTKEF